MPSYDSVLKAATQISKLLGTWVIYETRDAVNIEHLAGYLRYKVADFNRRRERTKRDSRRGYYTWRITSWRAAIRWVESLDEQTFSATAKQILSDFEKDEKLRALPFLAETEAADPKRTEGGARAKLSQQPRRRPGRPSRPEASA